MKLLLRRDRLTSALIVLVLALGIGGNAAIFTLLKAAFLDPLPYRESGRLVTVMENSGWIPSTSSFQQIRERTRTLDQFAFAHHIDMQISGQGEAERVYVARVTASFFPLLGANPALGRIFTDDDNRPGATPAIVLSDTYWRSHTGGDPHVIGRTLRLDGQPATVAGVLPPGFHFDYPTLRIPEPVDIYVAYPLTRSELVEVSANGRGTPVRVIARLRDGVTFAQAASDLRRIARELTTEHPASFPNPQHDPSLFSYDLFPLRDAIVGTQRSLLWLLLGGVGVLLLIACANTAQLLLARSLRRGREVAIRTALGATRPRLIREFLFEGFALALAGGAVGLLLAAWILRVLVPILPVRSPLLTSAHLDLRAIAFTLAISLVSALTFAMLPAVKGSRWSPGPSLTARSTAGEGNRWRHAMIAIEAALSVFLLCGAGLVAQNLWTLISSPMGFDPNQVLAMRLKLPARPQEQVEKKAGVIFQEYVDRIEAIPGVEAASTITGPPLRPARGGNAELSGVYEAPGKLKSIIAWSHQVNADYFRALRIPLLAGRNFRRDDAGPRATVAIVNQEFARRFGFGANIVGQQLDEGPGGKAIEIIGMVGDVRTRGLRADPFPEVYLSSLQLSWSNVYLVVRSAIPPNELLKQVKAVIGSANSDQAVFGVQPLGEFISDAVAEPKFDVLLIGAFALLAVAMAAAGMYSVIACLVTQRTGEIAIRIALGAARRDIVRTILGTTLVWVAAGLACGLGVALLLRNTVRALSNTSIEGSPWMYGAVLSFFFVVTLLAAFLPMRRANNTDPAIALRTE